MKTAISTFTPDCKPLQSILFYWQSSVSLSGWDLTLAFQSCCPGSVEKLNESHWFFFEFPGVYWKISRAAVAGVAWVLHLSPQFLQAWTISVFMEVSCFLYLSGAFTAAKGVPAWGCKVLSLWLNKIHIKTINQFVAALAGSNDFFERCW